MPYSVRLPAVSSPAANQVPGVSVVVITYTPPQSAALQFLSLEPLVLLKPAQTLESHENPDAQLHVRYRHLSPEARAQQLRLERLTALDPTRAADLRPGQAKHTAAGSGLRMAVILMNAADEPFARGRPPDEQMYGAAGKGLALLVRASASACRALSSSLRQPLVRGHSIKDVSASVRQLDLRLRQIAVWPALGRRLRVQRRHERVPVCELSARYIGLWNGVWLVANDLILGGAVGSFVCEHHEQIAQACAGWLRDNTIVQADEVLVWLGQWPGGLKLNAELSLFFGDMYRGTIDVYALFVFAPLEQALPRLVYAIGLAGSLAGLTMLLSLAADLLAVATLHLSILHRIARAILGAFTSMLFALFRLFRGKKRNWLRGGRIDNATYDADQLLLGTILFTILIFLFPTVMTYHVVFALARLGIVSTRVLLDTALALLNHLPLFALMLRLKDPARLPSSVRLAWAAPPDGDADGHEPLRAAHFELHSVPLGLGDIFAGYSDHLVGLTALPRLCLGVLTGAPIDPIDTIAQG
jgi:phosphatidylinositol glycan class Q protein